MLLPSKVDLWWADAVTRVYAPWMTSNCIGISERQRRDIAELIERARRAANLPPLDVPFAHPHAFSCGLRRARTGRWTRSAA